MKEAIMEGGWNPVSLCMSEPAQNPVESEKYYKTQASKKGESPYEEKITVRSLESGIPVKWLHRSRREARKTGD